MKYIWLFGENLGNTANNNSYYTWKHIVDNHDDVEAYLILSKIERNKNIFRNMTKKEQDFIVWRNSFKHIELYKKADMLFVSLSYRDVTPDKILWRDYCPDSTQPLVYLQHGTCAMKQLGYGPGYSNNCLFRFLYYNPYMKEQFMRVNKFKEYQLYDGKFLPRYVGTIEKNRNYKRHEGKKILWFLTWREYFGANRETERFIKSLCRVIENPELLEYSKKTKTYFTIGLHSAFSEEQKKQVQKVVEENPYFQSVDFSSMDVMDEIAKNDVLITDYSSVGFDFTLLNKPVILFQPDRENYLKKRKLYCSYKDVEDNSITEVSELVDCLIKEKYNVNPFFLKRMPQINLDKIASGYYIEKLYQDLLNTQKDSYAFLGYDFSGIGGGVFATRAIVEGLLEQGKLVRLYTCKRMKAGELPYGAPILPMYNHYKKVQIDKVKDIIHHGKRNYLYFKDDPSRDAMKPYIGYEFRRILKNIHANTVVSTRESIHFFLYDTESELIKNKVFFFHTAADVVEELFPGAMHRFKQMRISNAVFVTEKNRQALIDKFGFKTYDRYTILGNALESRRCIGLNDIRELNFSENFKVVYLLRISEERAGDIDYMLGFAKFLKDNNISNIKIDVFGNGDYVESFLDKMDEMELRKYITYRGSTQNVKLAISTHDAVVDFSMIQSFGMTYIEAILNGKMVFCRKNEGALEVLRDIPECYYETYEELTEKILSLPKFDAAVRKHHYEVIANRYGRGVITQKFLDFVRSSEDA